MSNEMIAAVWLGCAVIAYGMALADSQKRFPAIAKMMWSEDCHTALFFALFGPFSLIGLFFATDYAKHGLMYRNPHKQAERERGE